MKKLILILIIGLLASPMLAQDIRMNVLSPSAVLAKNRNWNQMNQVWIFRPSQPQISLYIFVKNNNPTNQHTLTLSVYQTPDPSISDWTNNQGDWVQDTLQGSGSCATVPSSTMVACYVVTMFASQVAIRITGATTAAGSPDTANLFILQAIGEPKGQQMGGSAQAVEGPYTRVTQAIPSDARPVLIGGTNSGGFVREARISGTESLDIGAQGTPGDGTANSFVQRLGLSGDTYLGVVNFNYNGTTWDRVRGNIPAGLLTSERLSWNAYRAAGNAGIVMSAITNPAAGQDILNVSPGSSGQFSIEKIVISSTVAVSIEIYHTTSLGTTCTSLTLRSLQVNQTGPGGTFNHTCTTDPTVLAEVMRVVVPANNSIIIPFMVANANSTNAGISIKVTSGVTGVVTASVTVASF